MWRRKKQNKTTHTHHKTHLVDDKIKAESKFRNQRRVCVFYAPYRRTVLGKFLCFRLCLKGVCVRLCDFIPDSLSIYKENIQNDLNFIQSPCVSGTTLQYQNVNNSQCWARSVRFDKFYQFNAKTSNRSVYRIRNASTLWTFCSFIFSLSAHKLENKSTHYVIVDSCYDNGTYTCRFLAPTKITNYLLFFFLLLCHLCELTLLS